MNTLLKQLKKRRLALGLKQKDMWLRVGISRQQYQQIESKGNPRLDTLDLIAKGLQSELMLIPSEKLAQVKAILENEDLVYSAYATKSNHKISEDDTYDNPWDGLLEDDG